MNNVKRTETRTFVTRLMCEKCDGEMLPIGIALLSSPAKYPHKCNKCGCQVTPPAGKRYPYVEYE